MTSRRPSRRLATGSHVNRRVSRPGLGSPASPDARKAQARTMAIDTVDQTVVTQEPSTATGRETVRTASSHATTTSPGGSEMTRRVVVLVFGLIQLVIGLR